MYRNLNQFCDRFTFVLSGILRYQSLRLWVNCIGIFTGMWYSLGEETLIKNVLPLLSEGIYSSWEAILLAEQILFLKSRLLFWQTLRMFSDQKTTQEACDPSLNWLDNPQVGFVAKSGCFGHNKVILQVEPWCSV